MAGVGSYSKPNPTPGVRVVSGSSGHALSIQSANSFVICCPKKSSARRTHGSREMPVSFRHQIRMALGTISSGVATSQPDAPSTTVDVVLFDYSAIQSFSMREGFREVTPRFVRRISSSRRFATSS